MRCCLFTLGAALVLAPLPVGAVQVEKVKAGTTDALALPEDLFRLPPGTWVFARRLWEGDDPCTADGCEAGYTSGDVVVSVERANKEVRILAGFRGCSNVAWNYYDIGDSASSSDTKTIGKRIKKAVGTSAKFCKVPAPTVAALDARQLYPIAVEQKP